MNQYLSKSIHFLDTSEIRKVFDLASKIENPINLSIGQPDFPVPENIKEAIKKALTDNFTSYTPTQGLLQLREALSVQWKERDNIEIHPDDIMISAGVASLLYLLFDVFFDEGDTILLVDPYFLIYEALSKYHRLNIVYINEDFTEDDLDALSEKTKTSRIKAAFYSTPSNPSGKILSKEQLQALANFSRKTGTLLISDEIYRDFDYDNKFTSTACFCPENTITLGGFSKSHAMTGLRIGYMGVPENLRDILKKTAALQQYSIVCSPQPMQWGALEAVKTSMAKEIALMKKRRDIVSESLNNITPYSQPDGAFYLFAQTPFDGSEFVKRAIEKKLLIVPGFIFSQNKNTVRISYAQKEDLLREGLAIFSDLIKNGA
ncbi:MAG: pyridoxal phosphate-dependent aminotransferase [Spirochaetia bacterium]|nr:pyridoxal phosphate-dependent aminotransferase [Spirochaetia bacterium]